ncbi:pentapeptide repeat-containing protein [Shimia sp.]|uniref:pentapeptide repeat-containing protein n=1 Tax=Shimia sp. TaxID=1954381 RepID=UPI003BA93D1F
MTTIILPIPPEVFWTLTLLVGIVLLSAMIYMALPRDISDDGTKTLQPKSALGAGNWPDAMFAIVAFFWTVLALCLFSGLVATIGMIGHQLFFAENFAANRFPLIQLAALTATLGAVVALPFTVLRLKLTQEQTETAKAALFNEKITEAAADLHAQRQVTKVFGCKRETLWEDDIVRRNAAIDQLEGLVREDPTEATRVSRLLSVYVRELSNQHPPRMKPKTEDLAIIQEWQKELRVPRSDIQNAVQVLGRIKSIKGAFLKSADINLKYANLQSMDLSELDFSGADLFGAYMQGAILHDCRLCGADLVSADMEFSSLLRTDLDGTNLSRADLRGSYITSTKFTASTVLENSDFRGASVSLTDLSSVKEINKHIETIFGMGVRLGDSVTPPDHWPKQLAPYADYVEKWREWAAKNGFPVLD